MSYSRLLMRIIAESEKTNKEIIEECNKRGRKIDKSYLSKLLNGKIQAPAEELSRMFADICNFDERLLVVEGYLEKAPNEIKEAFFKLKYLITIFSIKIYENEINEEELEKLKEKLKEEPLADFVISLIDESPDDVKLLEQEIKLYKNETEDDKKIDFNMKLEEPLAIKVNDNGMFPKITENSKVILKLQQDYDDYDILALKVKESGEFIVRFALIKDKKIILKPLNNQFEKKTYNLKDVVILGKVIKVIMDI